MLRTVAAKVMWVGRATVFLVGLSVIVALVLGVATTAMGANGDFFKVGRANLASAVSTLDRSGAGPALRVLVDSGPPLAVNSPTKVANLNADRLDGLDSTALLPGGELPRGRTLRGHYDIAGVAAAQAFGRASDSISYGYRLASTPSVQVIRSGQASTTECPGTASSPEATIGHLCVYEEFRNNLASDPSIPDSMPEIHAPTRNGAGIDALSTYNANTPQNAGVAFASYGTWAVRGN
jgi:hypothetical protein